jgi:hypothetical protein
VLLLIVKQLDGFVRGSLAPLIIMLLRHELLSN